MNWWFLTGPIKGFKKMLKIFLQKKDEHVQRWAYTIEEGQNGYTHYHLKLCCSNSTSFKQIKRAFPNAHIEASNESLKYLRKPGNKRFVSSEDRTEIRKVRHAHLEEWQACIIDLLAKQGPRQLLVLVDELGNLGKSYLTIHLYECKRAFWCPPVMPTPKDIVQFLTSGYDMEEFIIIDIPRSWKWTDQLYTAIEMIKDGLIFDTRYEAKQRNIRGVKVLVFTNTMPKINKLSIDRWDIKTPDDLLKIMMDNKFRKIAKLGPSYRNT